MNERQPQDNGNLDGVIKDEISVNYINPANASGHNLRRLIAETIFSPKSEASLRYNLHDYEDELTTDQLESVRHTGLYDIIGFINEKACELGFADEIIVVSKGPFPTEIINSESQRII